MKCKKCQKEFNPENIPYVSTKLVASKLMRGYICKSCIKKIWRELLADITK